MKIEIDTDEINNALYKNDYYEQLALKKIITSNKIYDTMYYIESLKPLHGSAEAIYAQKKKGVQAVWVFTLLVSIVAGLMIYCFTDNVALSILSALGTHVFQSIRCREINLSARIAMLEDKAGIEREKLPWVK